MWNSVVLMFFWILLRWNCWTTKYGHAEYYHVKQIWNCHCFLASNYFQEPEPVITVHQTEKKALGFHVIYSKTFHLIFVLIWITELAHALQKHSYESCYSNIQNKSMSNLFTIYCICICIMQIQKLRAIWHVGKSNISLLKYKFCFKLNPHDLDVDIIDKNP